MKSVLKNNCGVEALEHFFGFKRKKFDNDEYLMSIASLISLANDAGIRMRAYKMSCEDVEMLKNPFIIYANQHFIASKHWNRTPWFQLPARMIVITEDECKRFEPLSIQEMMELKGAKGETTIAAAQTPQQPSTAEAVRAWVDAMPQVFETEMKYAPLQAQQEVNLAQQYAEPYGRAMKTAQEALYPGTSAIQEKLANQSLAGMEEGVPSWMRDQYLSDLRANMGANVGSGIAADYTSRGLLSLNEDWRRYNQNLGLSVTGRQPLTQATTPQTAQYSQNFTPDQVMGYTANTYGSYANTFGQIASSQNSAAASRYGSRMAMYGQLGSQAMKSLI
jgi:hypothetical protein